ncbi:MAG: carotenoid biosynthesis protein [Saprospiraceae bacterium]|nr:carotenoid biosynthesis protein [Saprospiraceae bacterium]
MQKKLNPDTAIWVLTVLYIVGIAGFLFKIHPDFPRLTPINLCVSLGVSLFFHPNWSPKFIIWCLLTMIVSFFIEVLGVQTGQIFGHYKYGETLGFKYLNTPLSISINWLLTAYAAAALVSLATKDSTHWLVKSVLSAALMVSLDSFIEPVAPRIDMWAWKNGIVPSQNYIGWFLTALPLQMLFFFFIGSARNKVAAAVLILQFIFFLILNNFL